MSGWGTRGQGPVPVVLLRVARDSVNDGRLPVDSLGLILSSVCALFLNPPPVPVFPVEGWLVVARVSLL